MNGSNGRVYPLELLGKFSFLGSVFSCYSFLGSVFRLVLLQLLKINPGNMCLNKVPRDSAAGALGTLL
jgi:hypothetical protein